MAGKKLHKTKDGSRRRQHRERRCANCWVCMRGTDLCPLAENYSEENWEGWFRSHQEKKKSTHQVE